ncbi:MAG: sulfite exporter TauE/SafE family protein [Saccharospirillum sp.]|nr:sulfite exporter TauE/SafE family protein [Saccharospirillum sp.]
MNTADWLSLVPFLAVIFVLSGMVKGLSGFGMPFIAIPASTIVLNVPITQAMSWVLVSGFATNIVQLFQNRGHWRVLLEIWPLILTLLVTMVFSVQLLSVLESNVLSMILGMVMVISIVSQSRKKWDVAPERKTLIFTVSGFASGMIGGLTSFYGFPSLQTLLASGMKKDAFIFSASFLLFAGAVLLAIGLGSQGLMTVQDGFLSIALFIPAVIGMLLGQKIRDRLSLKVFERVVMVVLLLTGLSMLIRGIVQSF